MATALEVINDSDGEVSRFVVLKYIKEAIECTYKQCSSKTQSKCNPLKMAVPMVTQAM